MTRAKARTTIKMWIGSLLAAAMPGRTAQTRESFALYYWGRAGARGRLGKKVDSLTRFYLANKELSASRGEGLEKIHKEFWSGEIDPRWYTKSSARFETKTLPRLASRLERFEQTLVPKPIETVCEIGTGDGRFLAYLKGMVPQARHFIGIDLSAERIAFNRTTYPEIQFVTGDAAPWITSNNSDNILYVTNGGVLEYFSQRTLESVLRHIVEEQKGSVLALFQEGLDPTHDLATELESRLMSYGEYSFSHNYPHLISKAGFKILHAEEGEGPDGSRRLTVFAEAASA